MCEDYDWPAIDPANWRDVPFIEGRLASETDIRCGRAVFHLDGNGRIAEGLPLPALARLKDENGQVETVVLIQYEGHPYEDLILVGYRTFDGGNGVATLPELEIIEEPGD